VAGVQLAELVASVDVFGSEPVRYPQPTNEPIDIRRQTRTVGMTVKWARTCISGITDRATLESCVAEEDRTSRAFWEPEAAQAGVLTTAGVVGRSSSTPLGSYWP
jgi:hypothetical protein